MAFLKIYTVFYCPEILEREKDVMESRALVFDVEDCYTSQRGAIHRREQDKMAVFNYVETGDKEYVPD